MKKREIKTALEALKKIHMTRIEDKPLRNHIITIHLALLKEQRKYEADVADLEETHMGPFSEEREKIGRLQRQLMAEKDTKKREELASEINGYVEVNNAWDAFNRDLARMEREEVATNTIPQEKFLEEIQKQDFDLGQIEALFPLFE